MLDLFPGQRIVFQEIVKGRIWIERPAIVVAKSDDELVVACPAGTIMKFPDGLMVSWIGDHFWRCGG
jgi:hypothetical protein